MIIRFHVTRKDTGAPVEGAVVVVEKSEGPGTTDATGIAEIITYWSGNWIYSVNATGYNRISGTVDNRDIQDMDFYVSFLIPATPPPPPTDPSGAVEATRVGTSCSIMGQGTNGNYYYAIKHDRNGYLTNYHKADLGDVIREAELIPACFETPPPPPPTTEELGNRVSSLESTVSGITSAISSIQSTISEIISAAEEEAASWRAGLDTAVADLRGSLTYALSDAVTNITAVTDILIFQVSDIFTVQIPKVWTSLDDIIAAAETEAAAWRKGVLDLDASLKAWISASILDIIWAAITRDSKED